MALLWKTIFDAELARLKSGTLKPGEVFATVQSLAESHHVSDITARRVLTELAKAGAVKNVPRRGSVVAAEKAYASKIFLLSPEKPSDPEGALIVSKNMKGIFEEAVRNHLEIQPVSLDFLLRYTAPEPAFVIYHYSANKLGSEVFLSLFPAPLIPVAVQAPVRMDRGISVGCDSKNMMRIATEYFIKQGFRRIGYAGATGAPWFRPRFESYVETLSAHKLEFSLNLFLNSDLSTTFPTREIFIQWIETAHPDAICCPGLGIARELYRLLPESMRKTLPICAIGESPDGELPFATVRPNYVEQGNMAVQLIQKTIPAPPIVPKFYSVSCKLVIP